MIGFGHLRRSVTLARKLTERVPVHLQILNDGIVLSLADDVRAHLDGIHWRLGIGSPANEADVVILDLEQSNHLRFLARPTARHHRCLALDWFNPAWLPAVTMNLMDHRGQMRAAYLADGRPEDYKEGPDYAIIRPGILALRNIAPTAGSVHRIAVTMGGADPKRLTLEAVQQLHKMAAPDSSVTVIIGPLFSTAYEQEIRNAAPGNFEFLRNPTDFDQHLADADIVLCSGGGTLLESLSLGRPTVVFPQNEAEEAHAWFHAQVGACVFADSLRQILAGHGLRNSLVEKARRQVDGRGVERIAQAALELLHRKTSV